MDPAVDLGYLQQLERSSVNLDLWARHMSSNVGRDRDHVLGNARKCFTGQDAVEFFLKNGYASAEAEAITLCTKLYSLGLIVPVGNHTPYFNVDVGYYQYVKNRDPPAADEEGEGEEDDENTRNKKQKDLIDKLKSRGADRKKKLGDMQSFVESTKSEMEKLRRQQEDTMGSITSVEEQFMRCKSQVEHKTENFFSFSRSTQKRIKDNSQDLKAEMRKIRTEAQSLKAKEVEVAKYQAARVEGERNEHGFVMESFVERIEKLKASQAKPGLHTYLKLYTSGLLLKVLHYILSAVFFVFVVGNSGLRIFWGLPQLVRAGIVLLLAVTCAAWFLL